MSYLQVACSAEVIHIIEDDVGVGTAKSKTVRDGNINTPLLRDFGDIVAIELVARVPWMF